MALCTGECQNADNGANLFVTIFHAHATMVFNDGFSCTGHIFPVREFLKKKYFAFPKRRARFLGKNPWYSVPVRIIQVSRVMIRTWDFLQSGCIFSSLFVRWGYWGETISWTGGTK
ncbi:hypothetical protein Mboo_1498 [Methanoregula boonei 6A8]|jgi:hypothetical protein|uniref:Uncharacterized protein n=1 Tax=Methanoregula boonei (strain DSM 21154 / JCM 14090 / 6A8) TaxID=456442 RepID=A7I8F5_METB6|nr:hypothetical protein Mboo_1498 [Methanoregula boonei 6A8]